MFINPIHFNISSFEDDLKKIPRGSYDYIINSPQIVVPLSEKEIENLRKIEIKKKEEEQRKIQEIEENERKEKEKKELLEFLEQRKTLSYNLEFKNVPNYSHLNNSVNNYILMEIKNCNSSNTGITGFIKFNIDTVGNKTIDVTNLNTDCQGLVDKIYPSLNYLNFNSIIEKGFKMNTFALINIEIACIKGEVEFVTREKKNNFIISYKSNEPIEDIKNEIHNKFKSLNKGKYRIKYDYIINKGTVTIDISIISFK
jgi:hypothetical protein